MKLIDQVLSAIAPVQCVACGRDGHALCLSCAGNIEQLPPRCAGCKALSDGFRTCSSCRWLGIHSVFVATRYEGVAEKLVHMYKFTCVRQTVTPVVAIMHGADTRFSGEVIFCPLPTANPRIRLRGFDHAMLMTREYWRGLPSEERARSSVKALLRRTTNTRQLGSSRTQRIQQAKDAFELKDASMVGGRSIVLVDDVVTTGASLAGAAAALKAAGAKRIYAVVFAQKY